MGITGFTGFFTLDDRDDFDLSLYDLNSLYCTNRLRVFWCIPCTVLYCTVLCCTTLYHTVRYCKVWIWFRALAIRDRDDELRSCHYWRHLISSDRPSLLRLIGTVSTGYTQQLTSNLDTTNLGLVLSGF